MRNDCFVTAPFLLSASYSADISAMPGIKMRMAPGLTRLEGEGGGRRVDGEGRGGEQGVETGVKRSGEMANGPNQRKYHDETTRGVDQNKKATRRLQNKTDGKFVLM